MITTKTAEETSETSGAGAQMSIWSNVETQHPGMMLVRVWLLLFTVRTFSFLFVVLLVVVVVVVVRIMPLG